MRHVLIFILFLGLASNLTSQFYKKHEDNSLKFYGSADIRNSIILDENLAYYGIKLGVGNNRFRFGIGYHTLQKNIFRVLSEDDFFNPISIEEKNYRYNHISVFVDPILHLTPRWELLFPIHLGIGPIKAFRKDSIHGKKHEITKDFVPSFTVSIKANYRILKWVGVTAGFGNNFVFLDDSQFGKTFNTYFYSVGIKLFFDEFGKLYRDEEYRKKYLWEPNFVKKYEQKTN